MSIDLNTYLEIKVKFFRGFADKTRLGILEALKDGEKTVSEIVEHTAGKCGNQSNISQNLSCLRGCGVIIGRQEEKYTYYRIRNNEIIKFMKQADAILQGITTEVWRCTQNDKLLD